MHAITEHGAENGAERARKPDERERSGARAELEKIWQSWTARAERSGAEREVA